MPRIGEQSEREDTKKVEPPPEPQAAVRDADVTLAEREARYRAVVETSADGFCVTDGDGRILEVNDAYVRRSGYCREELLRMSISDLEANEDPAETAVHCRKVIERGSDLFESAHRTRDGAVWPVEVNVSYWQIGGGRLFAFFRDITERKQAEVRLKTSEERYRLLVETANSVILTWDTAGTIQFVNKYGERFFGFDGGELVGRNVVGTIVPALESSGRDLERLMREIQENPDRFTDNENENVTKDGRRVWVRWANKSITDAEGRLAGILSVGNDITARKRAEEELARSERMLQTIIDTEPECVKLLDEGGNLILMNRAGLEMIEAGSLDEVKGRCVCPLVTSECRPAFMDLTRRVFRGETGTLLFEMVGLRGRRLWLETHAVPLRNERNEIVALLGVTRDVTERRRAEEQLRQSEEFIRNILDTVDEGFIVVDRDYRIRIANRSYCAQLGQTPERVVGQPCFAVAHGSARPCHEQGEECPVREVFATGEPCMVTHRHADAAGRLLHVEAKAYPVRNAAGDVVSAIETISNITERHLLEDERLKNQKLESIGLLAGGIAHDFNNLLQGVFGYIAMAKLNFGSPDRALVMLDQAEHALHLSVNLTTQLLTFAKGGRPVKKLVDLRPVIENATRLTLSGSRSDYRIRMPQDLWPAEVDEGQIGQVVQNIVLNADQSMPMGGCVVVTAANVTAGKAPHTPLLAPGDYVMISVQDAGVGIPEQFLGKVFDPYFTTKEKGSGLGLATSYSIVRNHGGVIDVRSKPGEGSTLMIYLPAASAAVRAPAAPAAEAAGAARAARVLLMDDEEIIRDVGTSLLGALGHEVEVARDGAEALGMYRDALAAGRRFDVVVLDLTIRGGMGGAETMRKLLEIDPSVTGIASSGYSDDATIADHLSRGFKAYLKKPYRLDQVDEVLRSVLR